MHRAARFVADQGVEQFLDIGTGIPTEPNLHQVVQAVNPGARIAYVDNDPIVLAHAGARMSGTASGATTYLRGDAREPATILTSPQLTDTIDLSRPVGVSFIGLLHFLDDDQAVALVRAILAAVAAGSYLVLAHGTLDVDTDGEVRAAMDRYTAAGMTMRLRDAATIIRLFLDGLDVVEPGLVIVERWRPDRDTAAELPDSAVSNYGVVARVPE